MSRYVREALVQAKDLVDGDVILVADGTMAGVWLEILDVWVDDVEKFRLTFGDGVQPDRPEILGVGLSLGRLQRDRRDHPAIKYAVEALEWSTDEFVAVRVLNLEGSSASSIDDGWVIYPKTWPVKVLAPEEAA